MNKFLDFLNKYELNEKYNILQIALEKYDVSQFTTCKKYMLEKIFLEKFNVKNNNININERIIQELIYDLSYHYNYNKEIDIYLSFIIELFENSSITLNKKIEKDIKK